MNKISTFLKNSYAELMEHVTWPTWSSLQQSTLIVLVATAVITLLISLMDFVSSGALNFIYSLFK